MRNKLYVHNSLNQKYDEVKIMISCIQKSNSVQEQTLLKSSIMLMLYNLVEGTFSALFSAMFDYITDHQIQFDDLNPKIQNLYLAYHIKDIGNEIEKLNIFRKESNLCNLTFEDFEKKVNLYSGNLDARKIREISKKYGITIRHSKDGEKLLLVKETRNKLAHGQVNFSIACRDITIEDMTKIGKATYNFMRLCIEDFEKYVESDLIN